MEGGRVRDQMNTVKIAEAKYIAFGKQYGKMRSFKKLRAAYQSLKSSVRVELEIISRRDALHTVKQRIANLQQFINRCEAMINVELRARTQIEFETVRVIEFSNDDEAVAEAAAVLDAIDSLPDIEQLKGDFAQARIQLHAIQQRRPGRGMDKHLMYARECVGELESIRFLLRLRLAEVGYLKKTA